jgi:hypothetical protein
VGCEASVGMALAVLELVEGWFDLLGVGVK